MPLDKAELHNAFIDLQKSAPGTRFYSIDANHTKSSIGPPNDLFPKRGYVGYDTKISIYPGSFNPLHKAHIHIYNNVLMRTEFFEMAINHMFKEDLEWTEFEWRVDQFKHKGRLIISNACKIIHKIALFSSLDMANHPKATKSYQKYIVPIDLSLYMGSDSLEMWFGTEDPFIIALIKGIHILDREKDGKILEAKQLIQKQIAVTGVLLSSMTEHYTNWTKELWSRTNTKPKTMNSLLKINSTQIRKDQEDDRKKKNKKNSNKSSTKKNNPATTTV